MQSITKVVETRDFPYNDEYLWKNNGKREKILFFSYVPTPHHPEIE